MLCLYCSLCNELGCTLKNSCGLHILFPPKYRQIIMNKRHIAKNNFQNHFRCFQKVITKEREEAL